MPAAEGDGNERHVETAVIGDRTTAGQGSPYANIYETLTKMVLDFQAKPWPAERWEFVAYLEGMALRVVEQRAAGTPSRLSELPDSHPARMFAAQVTGRAPSVGRPAVWMVLVSSLNAI